MNGQIDVVSVEVRSHAVAVDAVNDVIGDQEAASGFLVDGGELNVLRVEDVVDESESVLELLKAIDLEALGGLGNLGSHFTHGAEGRIGLACEGRG